MTPAEVKALSLPEYLAFAEYMRRDLKAAAKRASRRR